MNSELLDGSAIEEIAAGAAILGAGGGGDPTLGMLMAKHAIEQHGPITLISVEDVPDESWVFPLSVVGAPTVTVEKIAAGTEILQALRFLEKHLAVKCFGVLPGEIGGGNSMTPLFAAAQARLPVIDGDLMGRAFPEIQMTTATLQGISACPMSVADEKGNALILDAIDNVWAERLARVVTVRMGGSSHIANYALRGKAAKHVVIAGTISLARKIGRTLLTNRAQKTDGLDALVDLLGARLMCRGKVRDVQRRTERGFAMGAVTLAITNSSSEMKVAFQNENLIAWKDGVVEATVPDLITIVDEKTGRAIMTENLKYGQRVGVLGIPCDQNWSTPEALKIVGPRCFGYEVDYVPVKAPHA